MTPRTPTRDGKIIHFGIPEELHKRAKMQALKEDITLQAIIIKAMEEYLSRAEEKKPQ